MKDLKARRGAEFIQRLVAEGEHVHQDFKYVINDARKIARSISAFANNDGGALLIGVKDNGTIAGIRNEEDVYVIEQAAALYCKPAQHVEFEAIKCGNGITVIRAIICAANHRPVFVDEGNKTLRAYFRVADENITAHPLMVKAWQFLENGNEDNTLTLSDNESAILSIIDKQADLGVAPEDLDTQVMMSRRNLQDTIVRLLALKLIRFHHNGHAFILTTIDP